MSYKLTLILDDDQMADFLESHYRREYTGAAVADAGCAIMRDFGAVLEFEHIGFEHEAVLQRIDWTRPSTVHTHIAGPDAALEDRDA